MTVDVVADVLSSIFLILGAFLSLAAGVGLLRFPDAIARMHASTKPQILGLIFIVLGIAVQERRLATILVLLTVLAFQMITAPISAHMIGRAGYRTGIIAPGALLVDELEEAIDRAQGDSSPNDGSETEHAQTEPGDTERGASSGDTRSG